MKILVIDDDILVRRIFCDYLSEIGYSLCQASDGQSGCQVFRQEKPDLVVKA